MASFSLRPPPSTLGSGSTVWIYLRDSGGSQQDRSVEQQREISKEYCAQYSLVLIHPSFVDIHKSGGSTEMRSAFNEMIAISASGPLRPNGLLIWNFARFARDLDDAQIYKSILRKRNIVIHSLTDPIPEGPYSSVIETLIHVSDEQKKHEASYGAWRGLQHVVKQGAMPGTPPRGFMRQPMTTISELGIERQAHRWVPDPEWISRIRRALEMRSENRSLDDINKETHLYSSLNSYRTFFNNKLYIGILEFGSLVIEDYCEPIVSRETWDKVQLVQKRYERHRHVQADSPDHPRRQKSTFLLSGIAKCARCKSPLYGHISWQRNGESVRAYRCTGGQRRRDCELPRIPTVEFENLVIRKLHETFLQPEYFAQIINEQKSKQSNQFELIIQKRKELESELSKIRRQIKNVTNNLADQVSRSLVSKLTQLELDEVEKRQQIADLGMPTLTAPSNFDADMIKNRIIMLSNYLEASDPVTQNKILRSFIESVVVDRIENHIFSVINIFISPDLFTKSVKSDSGRYPQSLKENFEDTVPTSHPTVGAPL